MAARLELTVFPYRANGVLDLLRVLQDSGLVTVPAVIIEELKQQPFFPRYLDSLV